MKIQCIGAVLLLALGFAAASSNAVTPIEKVISLLEDLEKTVKEEAKEEAKTYDEFACFCKDNTKDKSEAIKEGLTNIDEQTATIEEETATMAEKETELAEHIKQIESLTREIAEAEAKRAKENDEHERVKAYLERAIESMEGALAALEKSKPSLTQIRKTIAKSVALADVLELSPKHVRALKAFLQVNDDDVPEGEYEFHGDAIIELLEKLKEDFKKNLDDEIEEEEKLQKKHEKIMEKKNDSLDTEKEGKELSEEAITECKEAIAKAKEELIEAEAKLKDDQLYLGDLTARCESKAKEWDQRMQARAGEIEAITQALEVIKKGAKDKEAKRAMLQQGVTLSSTDSSFLKSGQAVISSHRALDVVEDDVGDFGLSLVQLHETPRVRAVALLQKARDNNFLSTTMDARREQALEFLGSEGRRLGSALLISMALKLGPDPFKKVKQLIQALVEKLLQEMADQATQKGFCDTELGKAYNDRDSQHEKTQDLNARLAQLQVDKAQLEESVDTLTKELEDLNQSLDEATKLRDEEKEENSAIIKDSTEGNEAVKEAIVILKDFYSGAAKNKVLLQNGASPIDEGGAKGKPAGAYKGNQDQASGIIGMLEVIQSDFERSVTKTSAAEAESHRTFVLFDRESKGSIMSKETGKAQSESDLKNTDVGITNAMEDLSDSQKLLDDALKAVEELVPTCIDTGMSYSERVAARKKEIKALKKALEILAP